MPDAFPAWVIPVVFGLMGACIGSFLNVVIYRMPRGVSVNDPARSFCPECGKPIPWFLNIPVLSWLALRGKSACCGTRISFRYCFVELLTALLFAAIGWKYADASTGAAVLLCLWTAMAIVIIGRCAVVYKISKGCHSILKILMEINAGVQDCNTNPFPRDSHGIYDVTIYVFSCLIHITIFSFFY